MSTGRISEARRWRDATAAGLDHAPHQLLLLLAEDEDHLAALLREEGDYYFYDGATRFLNLLSSEALWRLAARSDVAHNRRALFARVVWTRSYARALPTSGEHDSLVRTLNPELTAQWVSPAGRQVEADGCRVLLDVLSSPALNILITPHNRRSQVGSDDEPGLTRIDTFQHSDNNWWCSWQLERHDENAEEVLLANFMPEHSALPLESTNGFSLRSELGAPERQSFMIGQQDRTGSAIAN